RQMRFETGNRVGRHQIGPSRRQGDGFHYEPQPDAIAAPIHRRAANAPNETRLSTPSRQDERDERGEIAVIHPALHDIGSALGDEAGKLEQTGRDAADFVESQLDDRDAPRAYPFHMGFAGVTTPHRPVLPAPAPIA